MADLNKIKSNVGKMVDQNAPEADIDAYLSSEGVTADQVKAHSVATPPQAQAPAKVGVAEDSLKSGITGVAKGFAAIGNVPHDLGLGANYLLRKVGAPEIPLPATGAGDEMLAQIRAQRADNGIPNGGALYKPQTIPGSYAETIGSFLPGGEGSLARRTAQTLIPAVASETAGQLTKGSPLEPYARAGGAVVGAVVGNPVARGAIRSINAASVGKGGPTLIDPEITAQTKLRSAIDADGGPDAAGRQIVAYQNSGASGPSLVDVGGGNVRRLVRAAASGGTGDAQNLATSYAGRIRANFQDQVLDHTNGLTPGNNFTATNLASQLERNQQNVADTTYREPYSQPATVTPEMVDALQGPEGRAAINRAYTAARANRNVDQMAELSDLRDVAAAQSGGADPITGRFRTMNDALAGLSARSLDRVRIGMRDTGIALVKNDKRDIASGYFGRVKDIDTALDQTPGLRDARQVYRQMQGEREALDVGGGALSMPANEYAASIAALANRGGPANLGVPLQTGARQSLVTRLEAGADGATGPAKTISQSSRATQNLGATFGQERAGKYQAALGHEVQRVNNADFISPSTGSQTQLRGGDESLLAQLPTSKTELLTKIVDTLRGRGATLTDAERAAIVRLGTSEADLRRLAARNPHLNSAAIAQIAASNPSQGK